MATLPPISFEFFPPRNEEGIQSLELVVKNLNLFDPDFYSVTFFNQSDVFLIPPKA